MKISSFEKRGSARNRLNTLLLNTLLNTLLTHYDAQFHSEHLKERCMFSTDTCAEFLAFHHWNFVGYI